MNILNLPEELLYEIFSYLKYEDLVWKVAFTCTAFLNIVLEKIHILEIDARKDQHVFGKAQKLLLLENLSSSIQHLIVSRESDDKKSEELQTLKLEDRQHISIFLRSRRITDTELLYITQRCKLLKGLVLNKCCMLSFTSFDDVCCNLKNLQAIKILGNIQLTDKTVRTISSNCIELRTIHLVDCTSITDAGIKFLSENCDHVQDLNIYGCKKLSENAIKHIGLNMTKLRSFTIGVCPKISNKGICFLVKRCALLMSLNFRNFYQLMDEAITMAVRECKYLESLNLWSCDNLHIETVICTIADNCKQLLHLNLGGLGVLDGSIQYLSNECKNLLSINLTNCYFLTDEAIISLSINCTKLKKVELMDCEKITDASIKSLANNCPDLRWLDITRCYKVTHVSIKHVRKHCKKLERLYSYL